MDKIKLNLFNLKAQDNLKKKWKKKQFDLVISMGCLHNLTINDLLKSFYENALSFFRWSEKD